MSLLLADPLCPYCGLPGRPHGDMFHAGLRRWLLFRLMVAMRKTLAGGLL